MVTKPTKWLITGGCGFIGTSLIKNLMEEGGHAVRVLDNLTVGNRDDLAGVCDFVECYPSDMDLDAHTVELIVGDIREESLALEVTKGVDVIVHLAANTGVGPSVEDPRLDCVTNVLGIFNYLEGARQNKVPRFVFASSGAPVGECEPPIHEELACHPVSPYGASKLAGEGYCSAYFRSFGVETVALRFGNVYGPGSGHKNSVVAKFIKLAMAGETLEIYGDGTQTRDFIYIDDLVRAVRLAASVEGIGGEVFQIATNSETTVNELVDILVPILEQNGIKDVKVIKTEPRLGDVKRNFSDITKAAELLEWIPQNKIWQGIDQTIKHLEHSVSQ